MATAAPPDRRARLRSALIAALVAALGAVTGSLATPAKTVEKTVEVPNPVPVREPEVPVDYEGCHYHGRHHDEQPIEQSGRRWPADRITWSVDYQTARGLNPPLSEDAIRAAVRQAWGWWGEALDLEFAEVAAPGGMVPMTFRPIDGPAGTLAQAWLADGTLRPKRMEIDSSERWTAGPPAPNLVSLATVVCHEGGHSLGLGHDDPGAAAVMAPVYTARVPREQPRDVDRMVATLGYKRRVVPPGETPKAGGAATLLSFPVQAKAADLADALKKAGYSVQDPQPK